MILIPKIQKILGKIDRKKFQKVKVHDMTKTKIINEE